MNSPQSITTYFESAFKQLAQQKREQKGNTKHANAKFKAKLETTYNIACEVLGSQEADAMATKQGL